MSTAGQKFSGLHLGVARGLHQYWDRVGKRLNAKVKTREKGKPQINTDGDAKKSKKYVA
jgi:hypothetical protein